VEDGIFWFCHSESILAHPEEIINRAEAALEGNTCSKGNLFTTHSLQQISSTAYSFSVYEASKHSVKLSYILEKLCRLIIFIKDYRIESIHY